MGCSIIKRTANAPEKLGEVDIHQVSQTRERLLTATGQHIDSRITYYETTATLEGLVGAEIWSTEEDTP